MLVLGPDALTSFRSSMKALSADLDAWQQTSIGTSFTTGGHEQSGPVNAVRGPGTWTLSRRCRRGTKR
jgi:hypothetical protein